MHCGTVLCCETEKMQRLEKSARVLIWMKHSMQLNWSPGKTTEKRIAEKPDKKETRRTFPSQKCVSSSRTQTNNTENHIQGDEQWTWLINRLAVTRSCTFMPKSAQYLYLLNGEKYKNYQLGEWEALGCFTRVLCIIGAWAPGWLDIPESLLASTLNAWGLTSKKWQKTVTIANNSGPLTSTLRMAPQWYSSGFPGETYTGLQFWHIFADLSVDDTALSQRVFYERPCRYVPINELKEQRERKGKWKSLTSV